MVKVHFWYVNVSQVPRFHSLHAKTNTKAPYRTSYTSPFFSNFAALVQLNKLSSQINSG